MSDKNMNTAYINEETLKEYLGKTEENKILCNEERQFALFLYNVFLEKKRRPGNNRNNNIANIVNKCLFGSESSTQEFEIQDIYFEATLMRDYFQQNDNKEKFNTQLLLFCLGSLDTVNNLLEKLGDKKNHNLGQRTVKTAVNTLYNDVLDKLKANEELANEDKDKIKEKARIDVACMMMNATPDILVVYRENDILHVQALECKYKSSEGDYPDVAGAHVQMQFYVQECIMSFLFGKNESSVDSVENRLPVFPKKSPKWTGNESLWKEIYYENYKAIISQEWEKNTITNHGVTVIKFMNNRDKDNKSLKTNYPYRELEIENLLEEIYYCKSEK